MKKIVLMCDDYWPHSAGIGHTVFNLAESIGDEYDVHVITYRRDEKDKKFQEYSKHKIHRLSLRGKFDKSLKADMNYIFSAYNTLLKIKPEIIISNSPITSFISGLYTLFSHRDCLSFANLHSHPEMLELKMRIIAKIGYVFNKRCLVTNKEFKQVISGYKSKNKIYVMPNIKTDEDVINTDREKVLRSLKLNPKKKYFISVGRLVVEKGVEVKGMSYVIKAWPLLQNLDVILLIFGEGPLLLELKNFVKENNLEKRVIFMGYTTPDKLIKYIYSSEALILASLHEGLSMSFLEASSVGTPLITTKTSGVKNYITEGKDGFYINFKDQNSIAQKVDFISSMKQKDITKLRKNSFQLHKKNFNGDSIKTLFKKIIKNEEN